MTTIKKQDTKCNNTIELCTIGVLLYLLFNCNKAKAEPMVTIDITVVEA